MKKNGVGPGKAGRAWGDSREGLGSNQEGLAIAGRT